MTKLPTNDKATRIPAPGAPAQPKDAPVNPAAFSQPGGARKGSKPSKG